MSDAKAIFTDYYKTNHWGSNESVSGKGSTMAYTENLRKALPGLLKWLGATLLVDIPCGDFNWMQHVVKELPNLRYVGGDIVPEMIEKLSSQQRNDRIKFVTINLIDEIPPFGNVLMCRDCLFHFSDEDIRKALYNFVRSGTPWLLTTSHPGTKKNTSIKTGQFAPLNLEIAPWHFDSPRTSIRDWIEGFPVRYMGLWGRDEIRTYLGMR